MSSYNLLEEFAIDLAHKFKQIKVLEEGNGGFRYIGVANKCLLDAKQIMRQIKDYVKTAEKSDGLTAGDLELNGKTIVLSTGALFTTVTATYTGEISGYLVVTITDVADVFPELDLPCTLDVRVSSM